MANNDQLDARREEARRAMEGDARHAKTEALEKRRYEARRAMEGEEHRSKRETVERLAERRRAAEAAAKAASGQSAEAKAAAEAARKKQAVEEHRVAEETRFQKLKHIEQSSEQVADLKKSSSGLSPIHTFKMDMARAVKDEGVSVAKMALAEQARGGTTKQEAPTTTGLRRGTIIASTILLLIIIAGGAYYYFFYLGKNPVATINQPAVKSLVFSETSVPIDLSQLAAPTGVLNRLSAEANQKDFGQQAIKQVYLTNVQQPLSFAAFRQAIGLSLPDTLGRNLTANYLFGIYNDGVDNHRFLVLEAKSFEQAFSGLLEWEGNMVNDLSPLLFGSPRPNASLAGQGFKDRLIRNKDTRYLADSNGQIVLLYAFLDKEQIAIVRDEATFLELLQRFGTSQPQ